MNKIKRNSIDGWLILDKPVGLTSTRCLSIVKRLTGVKKAGHGGTLDPLASGVLPIAFGEATKAVRYVLDSYKSYEFGVRWGIQTTTDDAEGDVILETNKIPGKNQINFGINKFLGDISQVPPAFSAIKVDGNRSYNLARQGKPPKLKSRKVTIKKLELVAKTGNEAKFFLTCSKGTYVRSIARDMALLLGTAAHVTSLRRVQAGSFDIKSAFSLDSIQRLSHSGDIVKALIPILKALDDIPAIVVGNDQAKKLRYGQDISSANQGMAKREVVVVNDGNPVAVAKIVDGLIKPVRVFNFN
tara:strand:+ start:1280 stop:2179 length:900 start_codon:yes stop_codon:yes gene_type:complete